MKMIEVIPSHVLYLEQTLPSFLCKEIVYKFDKGIFNQELSDKIWHHLEKDVPLICDEEKFVAPGKFEVLKIPQNIKGEKNKRNKKRRETTLIDDFGNNSSLTIYVFLNDNNGDLLFYPDHKRNIFLSVSHASLYRAKAIEGNSVIYSNHIMYEEENPNVTKYILKIPIFYTSTKFVSFSFVPKIKKRVRFAEFENQIIPITSIKKSI